MLFADQVVLLRCEGTIEGNRFLDGRTLDGSVGLAPNSDHPTIPPFTGALWATQDAGGGNIFIMCLGAAPGNRLLDGRTLDGTVGLAPNSDPPFSGTRWRPHDAGGDFVTLECRGDIPGNRFLDGRTADGTVGLAPNTDAPFSGTQWRVIGALNQFTFASDISPENRQRLIDRHRVALTSAATCTTLSGPEKDKLYEAYQRAINHTTLNQPKVNASSTVGGSAINVNFGVLFPQGDAEISQTLIHEMMHCAGFSHPDRRDPDPALGQSCAAPNPAVFDCPFDNGQYFGTPPLRAEMCIAGNQDDVRERLGQKADTESCRIDESGLASLHTDVG